MLSCQLPESIPVRFPSAEEVHRAILASLKDLGKHNRSRAALEQVARAGKWLLEKQPAGFPLLSRTPVLGLD